ncbi:MAG TPA: hypothetical protein VN958_04200, partial [Chitinophagaceae bacterium]|nr:hypothetical protein [Chitinophagaceae bacterium]
EAKEIQQTESINIKAVNYTELIPVIIKALQELSAENKKLREDYAQLQAQMDKINTKTGALSLSGGYLGQNSPNPGNNSTIINFRIPEGSSSASLLITATASGKIIRTIPVAIDASQVTLETGSLASGAYTYSLLINGKKVDTKQMLIQR